MRLEGSRHTRDWVVWHVPGARQLFNVLWVDDEAALYCQHVHFSGLPPAEQVVQAKRVLIRPQALLVLIDPVDDGQVLEEVLAAHGQSFGPDQLVTQAGCP